MLNPENQWTRGRSATKFFYTYADIAFLTGLKVQTVWKYARLGVFDPTNLEEVICFIEIHSK